MPDAVASDSKPPRRRHRLRKIAIGFVATVAVLLLIVAVGGPVIIGALAPAVVRSLDVPGSLDVEEVSLSWTGEINLQHASLHDAEGEHVATVSARTGGGLLGLLDFNVEQDIVVDGWATVRLYEDGTTNLERALGLERSNEPKAEDPERDGPIELPFARVMLDGLDLALTREGSSTLAVAGLEGELRAEGTRTEAALSGTLTMPTKHPSARSEISAAASGGRFEASADVDLDGFTGAASAAVTEMTPEYAETLAAISGNDAIAQSAMVAARGGLSLNLDAELASGLPTNTTAVLVSETVQASFEFAQGDGAIRLASPGSIEIDASAFLANDAIREIVLPAQGVRVVQAGRVELTVQEFTLPGDGASPKLAELEAVVRTSLGSSRLVVPSTEGDATIDLSGTTLNAEVVADQPLHVRANARAAVNGQPEGTLSLDGRLDIASLANLGETGIDVASLARGIPSLELTLRTVPVVAATPWLAALEDAGIDLPAITGDTIDASVAWSARGEGSADVTIGLQAPHVRASADATWSTEAILLNSPATVQVARPSAVAGPWLPDGWAMRNGEGLSATIKELRLPMAGFRPELASATVDAQLRTEGVSVTRPDGPPLGIGSLELDLTSSASQSQLQLVATPMLGEEAASLNADLRTAGLDGLFGGESFEAPAILGSVTFAGPTRLARSFPIDAAGRPLHAWLNDAVGPNVTLTLNLTDPPEGDLIAGELAVDAQHVKAAATGLRASTSRVAVAGVGVRATPSQALWKAIAPMAGMEGSTLAQTSALVLDAGPAAVSFGGGQDALAGLDQTPLTLRAQRDIRINGVPTGQPNESGERPSTDVVLSGLRAEVNSIGRAISGRSKLQSSLDLSVQSPEMGGIAVVNAVASSDEGGNLDATATIEEFSIRKAFMLAGVGGGGVDAATGSLGQTGRIVVEARAAATPQAALPWSPQRVSVSLSTPRLESSQPIVARFTRETIELTQPTTITWTPDAAWLASAIGAEVTTVEPLQIRLDRVAVGNPLTEGVGLLDPTRVNLDASLDAKGATIAIAERPAIELDEVTGRVRRVAQSTYGITANASTARGGTLELNGLLQNPADAQGRLALESAEVRGTLKGNDIPVALADAMSNTDGLLADSLGPLVDLDAEIQHGRLIPGEPPSADLRFSVRGPRADASGYGRLENHLIVMTEPQTILTVREVRPEIAERFSQIIPELLQVEKRPEDGPAIIRTEGLQIPTNGEWVHGQGDVTIALGTARFRSSSVLSSVLKATGQREQGSLGRRIAPIHVTMKDGVITYDPFTLPLGDLELESEGTVNLVQNTMDVLVWIPVAALSDEAAGRFNTGLGSALGRSVPGFGRISTVPWRVTGELTSPSIRPAPQELIRRRGSEFLGPLLSPGESIQDLLGIPRSRRDDSGGG
ncbi:MAG: hypothetical protein RIE77_11775 [Phycisphaerales bacterium]